MLTTWLERHLTAVFGAFGALLLGAFMLIGVLFVQLSQARADLERVEGGAAFFGAQVQGFRATLVALEPDVSRRLDAAIAGLEAFRSSTLAFTVPLEQTVEIETEFVIRRDITVPVDTTLPIRDSFDTTVSVTGPLGIVVPVDVTVPIDLEVPVVLELTLPVDETIPVRATVPVRADLPVAVDVGETELAGLADALIEGLAAFRELVTRFGE